MSADLEIVRLDKQFAGSPTPALRDFSLVVAAGTCTAVLGPSGAGKSTLLRVVAGLERADAGHVRLGGRVVDAVDPERRGVGMVFQRSLLFPHLSVRDNVAFSDRIRGASKARARERAEEYLAMVRLGGFGDRRVDELSGGQEQRVAIARALAAEPAVLLLDEPFSALDPALRSDMHELLDSVRAAVAPTILLVTHDREEAARVSDRIAVVEHGELLHESDVAGVYRRPSNLRTSMLMGGRNAVLGEVRDGIHHSALGAVPARGARDGAGYLLVRQEDVSVHDMRSAGSAPALDRAAGASTGDGSAVDADTVVLAGVIEAVRVSGPRSELAVRCGDVMLHAEDASSSSCREGDRVSVTIPVGSVHVVSA